MRRALSIMSRDVGVLIAAALAIGFSMSARSQENPSELANYERLFEARLKQIQDDESAQTAKVLTSYRKRVEEALARYRSTGDLEAVRAIRGEIERIDGGTLDLDAIRENPISQIESLRAVLTSSLEPIRERGMRQELTLTDQYVKLLGELKTTLVKRGQDEKAIEVNQTIEALIETTNDLRKKLEMGNAVRAFPSVLESGLVLRYPFDDEDPAQAINSASTKWEGRMSGVEKVRNSEFGSAARFSGITDRILIEDELPDMGQMTFSVWVNNGGDKQNGGIFSDFDGAGARDLFFSIVQSEGVHLRADKDGAELKGMVSFDRPWEEGWNHLVWVMGSRESKVYLNGRLTGVLEQSGSNRGNHGASIGYAHNGGEYVGFVGEMDEVCIWRRTLTDREVEMLYQFKP